MSVLSPSRRTWSVETDFAVFCRVSKTVVLIQKDDCLTDVYVVEF
jgi:hypothetical protein